jgi:2-oxoglutarate dehydrogenase E2 component (dihydrolipoamide succinyltransferase)
MATGTQTDVVMPQMGVSVSEGTITKWLKSEGEQIAADEPLLEISTDKVDTEVPSPASGVVTQILHQEGETVEVGTVLAVIAPEGAEPAAAPEAPAEPAAPAPAAEVPEPATQAAADASEAAASEVAEPTPAPAPAQPMASDTVSQAPSGNGRTFVSPVVARIASEHGVDPQAVQGTGTGGRVTKKDILAFVESGGQPPAPAPAASDTVSQAPPAAPPRPRRPRRRPRRHLRRLRHRLPRRPRPPLPRRRLRRRSPRRPRRQRPASPARARPSSP